MAGSAPSPACKAYNWRQPFLEGTWTVRRLVRNTKAATAAHQVPRLILIREELSPAGNAIILPRSLRNSLASAKVRRFPIGTNTTIKFRRWWKTLASVNLVRTWRRAAARRTRARALWVLQSLPQEVVELVVTHL